MGCWNLFNPCIFIFAWQQTMNKLLRLALILSLIFVLSLGIDWPEQNQRAQFDITPYLNSPSDKPGSGPKKGPPYTPL